MGTLCTSSQPLATGIAATSFFFYSQRITVAKIMAGILISATNPDQDIFLVLSGLIQAVVPVFTLSSASKTGTTPRNKPPSGGLFFPEYIHCGYFCHKTGSSAHCIRRLY